MLARERRIRHDGSMTAVLRFLARYPILVATMLVVIVTLSMTVAGYEDPARWIQIVTVLVVIVLTAIDMIRDLLKKNFGLDILALVAMIATLLVGEYLAALIIVLMLTGGEALEDYASYRASRSLTDLLNQSPQSAHRFQPHQTPGEDVLEDIPVDDVRIGDELLVRPSEMVPVDATLLSASATLDESSLTGESLPVHRTTGDQILSGVLNGEQAIRIRAIRTSADSQYQQILMLVREAQSTQAPIVRLADRYAVPFTIVSLLIAGLAWAVSGEPLRFAQVLVLATPCPLLISAPVAFLGGLSRAARKGIVIKGGAVIEQLAHVRSVAFDKTGTLTEGRPELVSVNPEPGLEEDELLQLVASAEQYSSHVLAEGITRAAARRGLSLTSATSAQEQATNGVTAVIESRQVVVGKFGFVREHAAATSRRDLRPGELAVYVAIDGSFAGSLVLADNVRHESGALVEWLREIGVEHIAMLTGDAHVTAHHVATELGITDVHAELLPRDKVELVRAIPHRPVLMVGDGVNDAPVLAGADIGIAMGARGSTAAGEAADAVILKDSVREVADAVHISRQTLRIALQAIWIGIALSLGLMIVATTGIIPVVVGALIQEVVDLVAILYALRTLRGRDAQLHGATQTDDIGLRTTVA